MNRKTLYSLVTKNWDFNICPISLNNPSEQLLSLGLGLRAPLTRKMWILEIFSLEISQLPSLLHTNRANCFIPCLPCSLQMMTSTCQNQLFCIFLISLSLLLLEKLMHKTLYGCPFTYYFVEFLMFINTMQEQGIRRLLSFKL